MTSSDQENSWRSWALSNVPLIGAVLVAVLTMARLTQVSRGNRTTALTIVEQAGTANVLFAVVLDVLPWIVVFAVAALIAAAFHAKKAGRYGTLLFFAFFASLYFVPAGILVVGGAVFLSYYGRVPAVRRDLRTMVWTFLSLILFVVGLLLNDRMWLPAEEISTGSRVEVGYVLKESSDEVVLLREKGRQVVLLATSDIEHRRICELDGTSDRWFDRLFDRPTVELLPTRDEPKYSECRDPK